MQFPVPARADIFRQLQSHRLPVERAHDSPGEFAAYVSREQARPWRMARHHQVLDGKLLDLVHGRSSRLMVFEPPRHGKSEHGSKYFPAWFLGQFPHKHIILASATDQLAGEFTRAARDVFAEWGPQVFNVALRQDVRASDLWMTTHGGSMRGVGVGAGIMGRGADLFIIDDYFGKWEEALSEAERRRRHQWLHATMQTRLSPTGVVLLICTRYHPDDPAGLLLREQQYGGAKWDVIRFPAIAEEDDPLGRNPGEALWPEQWPLEKLEAFRSSYIAAGMPWMWEAMYQQNPPMVLDAEFDQRWFTDEIWFSDWPQPRDVVVRVVAVDPSLGKSDKADFSAIISLAKDIHGVYWVEADIERRPAPAIIDRGLGLYREVNAQALGCETNQFQELLGQQFEETAAQRGQHVWFCGIHNHTPKPTRIRSLTTILAQGRLRIRRTPGGQILFDQLRTFPGNKHDDGPDALEMGVRLCEHILRGTVREAPEYDEQVVV